MKSKPVKRTVYLDRQLDAKLKAKADANMRSLAAEMFVALEQYVFTPIQIRKGTK